MRAASNKTSVGEPATETTQYLTFHLGNEVFALGILSVKEIIEYDAVTTVPMMPDCIRGVINLRGAVVPVMDLSLRFGKPSSPVTKRTCIVIVEANGDDGHAHIGIVVDAVNAVIDIGEQDIEPPPAFGTRIDADFIKALGKVAGRFVIMLDVERILDVREIINAVAVLDGTSAPKAELE